jgi:RNA polymerase sigma factor (TIGR02999 family)
MSEPVDSAADGASNPRDRLLAAHYDEFRRIARRVLADDAGRMTMQPTDLAHEAAVRIMKLDQMAWHSRTHFLAVSARVMRQALLDEVRRRRAAKRQAPPVMTAWHEGGTPFDLEQFDGLLEQLFAIDPDRARVVELRFYAGLTLQEVARALSVSESTVERRWRGARAWLLGALGAAD